MSRKVVVASSATNTAKKIETSATTRGELVNSGVLDGLISGDVEFIANPGKITLGHDDSALPEGDFQLFIIPKKNKAGMAMTYDQLSEDVASAIKKAAALADEEGVSDLRDSLIETVADHFNVEVADISDSSEDDDELKEALAAAKNFS